MPAFCGDKNAKRFRIFFVEMIRTKTIKSVRSFYDHLSHLYISCKNADYKRDLALFIGSQRIIHEVLQQVNIVSLDPAIPAFVQHCAEWGNTLGSPYNLVHDVSKPIAHSKELLSFLMAKDEKEVSVGYDRRKMILPLKATGIKFADSKNIIQLQVADIFGGAWAYWAKRQVSGKHDSFSEGIANAGIERLIFDAVWPSSSVTPKELGTDSIGGTNAVDYISELITRQKKKKKST
jgi:hypothetical protein